MNQRGLFRRQDLPDVFAAAKIPSAQKWGGHAAGQHIELGIAENNLFLMLAALGLAGDAVRRAALPDRHRLRSVHRPRPRCAQLRLLPGCALHAGGDAVGRDARAGGRRPPVDQPAADRHGPAGPPPLRARLRRRAGGDDGGRLPADAGGGRRERLSAPHHPRPIAQVARADDGWKAGALAGGYWLRAPGQGAEAALVYSGALAPEALAAWEALKDDVPGLGLLAVTSPDLLHRGWSERRARALDGQGRGAHRHVETLLAPLSRDAGLVTLIDGAPASLSWLGGVAGHKVSPLGVERFGQTGNLPTSTAPTASTSTRSSRPRRSCSWTRLSVAECAARPGGGAGQRDRVGRRRRLGDGRRVGGGGRLGAVDGRRDVPVGRGRPATAAPAAAPARRGRPAPRP